VAKSILVAFTSPASPEVEDAYNEWYNNIHVADISDIPGVSNGRRYKLSDHHGTAFAEFANGHSYLVLYDIDGDPEAITAEMGARIKDGRVRMTPGLIASTPPAVVFYFDAI
jgi:hypothetical protein